MTAPMQEDAHRHRWVRSIDDHSERAVFACNRIMWRRGDSGGSTDVQR